MCSNSAMKGKQAFTWQRRNEDILEGEKAYAKAPSHERRVPEIPGSLL